MALLVRLNAAWLARSPREQRVLSLAAAVLCLALLFAVWDSLRQEARRIEKQLPTLAASAASLKAASANAPSQIAVSAESLRAFAANHNAQLKSEAAPWQFRLDNASGEQLFALQQALHAQGLAIKQLAVSRSGAGWTGDLSAGGK